MAEPRETGDKSVAIPVMPTSVTATQVIALILTLATFRYARGVLAPLLLGVLAAVALAPLCADWRAFCRVRSRPRLS